MKQKIYKGKCHPRTCHKGREGEHRYSSTLSSTSALDGGGWLKARPGRFTLGINQYPLCRMLGGPQGRSQRVRKISAPPEFDPRTIQAVVSCYTDYAISGHSISGVRDNIKTPSYTFFCPLGSAILSTYRTVLGKTLFNTE